MKISLTDAILSVLEAGATDAVNVAWAMMATKSESYRRIRSFLLNPQKKTIGEKVVSKARKELKEFHKYRVLLSRLKKQGLVEHKESAENRCWVITTQGIQKLQKIKLNPKSMILVDKPGLTIVSYDVPEKQRQERDRLREILKLADFEQAHKSLWFSKKKVTKDFLRILKELHVIEHIHIFEVNKSGSLNRHSKAVI